MPEQQFFLTADEQKAWLREILCFPDVWAVTRDFGNGYHSTNIEHVDHLVFEVEFSAAFDIFLGEPKMTPGPVWRNGGRRREIDFLSSYAVQFSPSCSVIGRKTLLSGRVAVFPVSRYPDPSRARELSKFYSELRSHLRSMSATDQLLVAKSSDGSIKPCPELLIGKEVALHSVRLEQFLDGPAEFQVVSRNTFKGNGRFRG